MHTHRDEDIRDRAYALWVEAGSPDGNDQHFWHQAERELAEDADADSSEEASEISPPPLPGGLPAH